MIPFWLSLAGGLGAISRFAADGFIRTALGRKFPWGTLLINVAGSFVLGLLTGLTVHHRMAPGAKVIIGTGFCGGFTTFSTASFESARLIEERRHSTALMQVLGNLGFSLAAAAAGMLLAGGL